jgi:hypothetical protein
MFPVPTGLAAVEQRLLALFRQLSEQDRATLVSFARYLAQQQNDTETDEAGEAMGSTEPLAIERPQQETVIAAMRRLRATYPMLDTRHLLDEASTLMSGHLLQGRPAVQVIDELEALFVRHYETRSAAKD